MVAFLQDLWFAVVAVLSALLSAITSIHAVLHKRDVRAAAGWTALSWGVPILGPVLYVTFGINRIRRRATELRRQMLPLPAGTGELAAFRRDFIPAAGAHLVGLAHLADRVTGMPLLTGNEVDVLADGDVAFPKMLEAIDQAMHSVVLNTYIFDNDGIGRRFADALGAAVGRGVEVRVLIDSVGARYSWPSIVGELQKRGVRVQRFLHSVVPWRMPYLNLRTHRKILVVDGNVGFTGGMNIRDGNLVLTSPRSPVHDVHFRIRGPVVAQMMNTFVEDWVFTTGELLDGILWFPELAHVGPVAARGIPDGPDQDLDKLRWAILGALAGAQKSVRVMTPYFLPDQTLITSLNVAAMRGVHVQIVMPERNNLPVVKWAATAQLWQVLGRRCEVVYVPPPFDHSKIMVVDDVWSLIGSANWDPRSLRLNFEFNIECYDGELADKLNRLLDQKVARGRPVTLDEVNNRRLVVRVRDGIARLFSPYL